ncbi:MAG: hypothetical protein PHX70_07725 [Clostridium sp.]|nr:hypothetical protein [Clostridium sp.]
MQGGQAIKNQTVDASGDIVNPKGIVYITANSTSGSKYYEMRYQGVNNSYEAVKQHSHLVAIPQRQHQMLEVPGSTNNATTNNQVQKETAASLNPSNAAKSITLESNLPKTGKFVDTRILIIIGDMLIFIGSLLFIIREKKII